MDYYFKLEANGGSISQQQWEALPSAERNAKLPLPGGTLSDISVWAVWFEHPAGSGNAEGIPHYVKTQVGGLVLRDTSPNFEPLVVDGHPTSSNKLIKAPSDYTPPPGFPTEIEQSAIQNGVVANPSATEYSYSFDYGKRNDSIYGDYYFMELTVWQEGTNSNIGTVYGPNTLEMNKFWDWIVDGVSSAVTGAFKDTNQNQQFFSLAAGAKKGAVKPFPTETHDNYVEAVSDVFSTYVMRPDQFQISQFSNAASTFLTAYAAMQSSGNAVLQTLMLSLQQKSATAYQLKGSKSKTAYIGGDGADVVIDGSSSRTIQLGGGKDFAFGGVGNDTIDGGADNDVLFGYAGNDKLNGGEGDDYLVGGAGSDTLTGGGGTDTADFSDAATGVTVDLTSGRATGQASGSDKLSSIEIVIGSQLVDSISGSASADRLIGLGGDDALNGRGGDDVLEGGDGNDILDGGLGSDVLDGGDGTDTASFASLTGAVTANLSTGIATSNNGGTLSTDTLVGIENLIGSAGGDALTGNASSNTIEGGLGNDILIGGANGQRGDTVSYSTSKASVVVDLSIQDGATAQNTLGAGQDILSGFENIVGGAGADTLKGDAGSNVISGGLGNDALFGGDGADWLIGGAGLDTLTGGSGIDRFYFDLIEKTADIVLDFERGVDKLCFNPNVFTGFAGATLAKGSVPVASGAGPTLLFDTDDGRLLWDADGNGKGKATLVATLRGVNDLSLDDISADQPAQNDVDVDPPGDPINGNRFVGTSANNAFVGGELNDSFLGNGGVDIFTGNGGSDYFIYDRVSDASPLMSPPPWEPQPSDGIDHITDFQTGTDKIVLHGSGTLAGLKSSSLQIIEVANGGPVPVTTGPTLLIYEPYPRAGTPYNWPGWLVYQADGFGVGEEFLAANNVITGFDGLMHASDVLIL